MEVEELPQAPVGSGMALLPSSRWSLRLEHPCWFRHGFFWVGLVGFILLPHFPQDIWIWLNEVKILVLHWLWGKRRGREYSNCSNTIPENTVVNKITKYNKKNLILSFYLGGGWLPQGSGWCGQRTLQINGVSLSWCHRGWGLPGAGSWGHQLPCAAGEGVGQWAAEGGDGEPDLRHPRGAHARQRGAGRSQRVPAVSWGCSSMGPGDPAGSCAGSCEFLAASVGRQGCRHSIPRSGQPGGVSLYLFSSFSTTLLSVWPTSWINCKSKTRNSPLASPSPSHVTRPSWMRCVRGCAGTG